MKRFFAILAFAAVCAAGFCGGGSDKGSSGKVKVGVSLPTQSLQRWNQDGANLKAELEKAGYTVDLQYAGENDIPTQVAQIENMIMGNCKVIIIAPIDGSALTEALKGAKDRGITVIAYDRLIMNTDAVSYFSTFDNYGVGVMQGEYVRDEVLDLDNSEGPFYMEIFTGPTDDNNTIYLFGGAMDVLRPYMDSGKIIVRSGQTTLAQCATPNWSTEEAQRRMENIIASNRYSPEGTRLDVVLCSNDAVANGVTNALLAVGYTPENLPIIIGQDCDITAIKNIIRGTQHMSIFKDTRILAAKTVEMVNAVINGGEVPINDTTTYNNGVRVIPAHLCEPAIATADNYKEVLIDSGYYKASEVEP